MARDKEIDCATSFSFTDDELQRDLYTAVEKCKKVSVGFFLILIFGGGAVVPWVHKRGSSQSCSGLNLLMHVIDNSRTVLNGISPVGALA